ncbi:hypothetical protein TTHERM_00780770 (macronuclear) [Tetrahymena thermophila SB210]|uniref:Uncharacterized protein n=1 Tax=Tetrahymena thermophila (strain SB210) TaxID=312017 RepID=I7MAS4_TETTS|nr:hypothetical protein TTHERM_00780770 [Tetrahymena thermophila SB210]EAS05988.2 hypothetical protein TTHERM_00780770 [Tetrahymena thermophila SB210]|eukprot:XP_001026233.2 hypothetical protein TTHERM_00780770 [Tetrahymena thermophila SB210]
MIKETQEQLQQMNKNGFETEQSQLQSAVKVQCICLFNMGILVYNQQNYKQSIDYIKKSFEVIEQFNLTHELQNLYFDFKNKYLETKERLLDYEKTNKLLSTSFQSLPLSPISPLVSFVQSSQNAFYKHFITESQNISGSSSLGIKSTLKYSNNQDQNIKENKEILEQQQVQFIKFNQKNQAKSPNLKQVRVIENNSQGIRFQSPQRQLVNISTQKQGLRSLSPPKNRLIIQKQNENQLSAQTQFDNVQQISIIQESSKKSQDLEQSIQISYPDTQKEQNEKVITALIKKTQCQPTQINRIDVIKDQNEKERVAKVKNTLKVLDQELKVKRVDSIRNKIEIFPNHIIKDNLQHIQFQARQMSPSRFCYRNNIVRQTNLDRLLDSHIQSQSRDEYKSYKLSQLKFENDLETIKINLSWSSSSDCDDREYNQNINAINKREDFLLDIDKRERLQFLLGINQQIQEKEYQKWQIQQQEILRQSKLEEIRKKIKARQIIKHIQQFRFKLVESNKNRLITETQRLKQEMVQKNFFLLKFYVVLMKYIQKQKQQSELFKNEKKNIVQTFVKLRIYQDNKFINEDYFVKTVQLEGQESQRIKFYVTLISKQNAKERFSSIFTSDEILMNLNLNRCKNQVAYTISTLKCSFITQVSPFIIIENNQVVIDWNSQKKQNFEKMSQNNVKEDPFVFEESIQMCSKLLNQSSANLINFLNRKKSFTGKLYNMLEKTIQLQNYFRRRICQSRFQALIENSKKRIKQQTLKKGTYYDNFSNKYYEILLVKNENDFYLKSIDLQRNQNKSRFKLTQEVAAEIQKSLKYSWVEYVSFTEEGQLLYSNINSSFINKRLKEVYKQTKQIFNQDKLKSLIKIQSFVKSSLQRTLFKLHLRKFREDQQNGIWVQKKRIKMIVDEKCVVNFTIDQCRSKVQIKAMLQNIQRRNCLVSKNVEVKELHIQGYYSNEEIQILLNKTISLTKAQFDLKNQLTIDSPEIEVLIKSSNLLPSISYEKIKNIQNRMAVSKSLTKKLMQQKPIKNNISFKRNYQYCELIDRKKIVSKYDKAEKLLDQLFERSVEAYLINGQHQKNNIEMNSNYNKIFNKQSSFDNFYLNDKTLLLKLIKSSQILLVNSLVDNFNKLIPSYNKGKISKRWKDVNQYNFTLKAEQINMINKSKILLNDFGFEDQNKNQIRCEVYCCKEDKQIIIFSNKLLDKKNMQQNLFIINLAQLGLQDHLLFKDYFSIRKVVMNALNQKLKYYKNQFSLMNVSANSKSHEFQTNQKIHFNDKGNYFSNSDENKIIQYFPLTFWEIKFQLIKQNNKIIFFDKEYEYLQFLQQHECLKANLQEVKAQNKLWEREFIFITSEYFYNEKNDIEYFIDSFLNISQRKINIIAYSNNQNWKIFIGEVLLFQIYPKLHAQVSKQISFLQTVLHEDREQIRNLLFKISHLIFQQTQIIQIENTFSLNLNTQLYENVRQQILVCKLQALVKQKIYQNAYNLKKQHKDKIIIFICRILYLEDKNYIFDLIVKLNILQNILFIEGFKIQRENSQQKQEILYSFDLKKVQNIAKQIQNYSLIKDYNQIKEILKVYAYNSLREQFKKEMFQKNQVTKIDYVNSVIKLQKFWRHKFVKDQILTKKLFLKNKNQQNKIKKFIGYKNKKYFYVQFQEDNSKISVKALQLDNKKKTYSGQVEENQENFHFNKTGENKFQYLWKKANLQKKDQKIVFNFTENQISSQDNLQFEKKTQISPQKNFDLTVVYNKGQKIIQNIEDITEKSNNFQIKKFIKEQKLFSQYNKEEISDEESVKEQSPLEEKNNQDAFIINVNINSVKQLNRNGIYGKSKKNKKQTLPVQQIAEEIAQNIQIYNDGSIIMDCSSINSQAIQISQVCRKNNYFQNQSDKQEQPMLEDNQLVIKPVVQCIKRVLKKGILYSESRQRVNVIVQEYQEDQNSFLRIQTEQMYYKCKNFFVIEVLDQNYKSILQWTLDYIQFETLIFISRENKLYLSQEKAFNLFMSSLLFYQNTLIVELNDSINLQVFRNRPREVLLINKKCIRTFQQRAREKLEYIRIYKIKEEWRQLKPQTITDFICCIEIKRHYIEQNEKIIKEVYYKNEINQKQKQDSIKIDYLKFIIYDTAEHNYILKCWDLSDYSSFQSILNLKYLRQTKQSNQVNIASLIQRNILVNSDDISDQPSSFFYHQSEEFHQSDFLQFKLNNFFVTINLGSLRRQLRDIYKKLKQN